MAPNHTVLFGIGLEAGVHQVREMLGHARLVDEANEALRLAQTRYDVGLGSIVELTQAQYTQTSAQIGAASAKYDYLSRRSALDYTTGTLR